MDLLPKSIKKKLVNEFLIIDAKDRKKLEKELKKLKLNYTLNGHYKLEMETLKPQNVIKNIQTQLSYLDIHSPTLEEAYLEIIKSDEKTYENT